MLTHKLRLNATVRTPMQEDICGNPLPSRQHAHKLTDLQKVSHLCPVMTKGQSQQSGKALCFADPPTLGTAPTALRAAVCGSHLVPPAAAVAEAASAAGPPRCVKKHCCHCQERYCSRPPAGCCWCCSCGGGQARAGVEACDDSSLL